MKNITICVVFCKYDGHLYSVNITDKHVDVICKYDGHLCSVNMTDVENMTDIDVFCKFDGQN